MVAGRGEGRGGGDDAETGGDGGETGGDGGETGGETGGDDAGLGGEASTGAEVSAPASPVDGVAALPGSNWARRKVFNSFRRDSSGPDRASPAFLRALRAFNSRTRAMSWADIVDTIAAIAFGEAHRRGAGHLRHCRRRGIHGQPLRRFAPSNQTGAPCSLSVIGFP